MGARRLPLAALVAASMASGLGPARAEPAGRAGPEEPQARTERGNSGYLARLAAAVSSRLDELAASRAPKLVPPVPVKVAWRPVKLGSIDLGAPLAALAAADLDGDGKGELYAVTANDVVGIGVRGGKAVELGRVGFAGARAVPAPRDVVGTAVLDGNELVAAASPWATELRVTWQGKKLVGQPGGPGFLVCPGARATLVPGRNYFGALGGAGAGGPSASAEPAGPAAGAGAGVLSGWTGAMTAAAAIGGGGGGGGDPFYGLRCRDDLVDPAGSPLRLRAQLALNGKLAVAIEKCAAGGKRCAPAGTVELPGVGAAFDLADVDRDGVPELIVSDDAAPGEPDSVRVFALGAPPNRPPLFKKAFQAGVAGIATVDSDGNGAGEVVVAVRLAGATRVDLWRVN